jgi:uncharacterized integral membrane protein (TIGR00697 family)
LNKQVAENPATKNRDAFTPLVAVASLMVASYLTANIMAVKLISIFGLTLFDAGTLTFPLSYMLGDVLTEVWGFQTAKKVIWLTFFCNAFLVFFTALGLFLPSPAYMEETTKAYALIFSYVPRIVLASLVGFLGGELSNAYVMVKIKALTKGRFLWMRTIGSSMVGYVFDTVLFVLLAFAGTVSAMELLAMIGAQYAMKLLIEALAGTPLAYAAIRFLKKKVGEA